MTQAFNLSQFANKVNTSGEASLTTAVTGTLPVANGGTGATTLTSGNVLIGAGTSAVTSVAAGANGNVLTSDGTTWTSAAASGGQFQTQLFTAPGTWTKPASCTQVKVTVIGGGGGGGPAPGSPGKVGGLAVAIVPVSAPVSITIGAGGNAGAAGGTSSFGPAVSATGGSAGPVNPGLGTGTVSVGTALKTGISNSGGSDSFGSIGIISGLIQRPIPGPVAIAYSSSGPFMAGARGTGLPSGAGGVSGAIVVEFVG
jgi:hypothetical protein